MLRANIRLAHEPPYSQLTWVQIHSSGSGSRAAKLPPAVGLGDSRNFGRRTRSGTRRVSLESNPIAVSALIVTCQIGEWTPNQDGASGMPSVVNGCGCERVRRSQVELPSICSRTSPGRNPSNPRSPIGSTWQQQ